MRGNQFPDINFSYSLTLIFFCLIITIIKRCFWSWLYYCHGDCKKAIKIDMMGCARDYFLIKIIRCFVVLINFFLVFKIIRNHRNVVTCTAFSSPYRQMSIEFEILRRKNIRLEHKNIFLCMLYLSIFLLFHTTLNDKHHALSQSFMRVHVLHIKYLIHTVKFESANE